MDKQIRDISKKRTWKRILKRSVALLCAVVMLFTMNTLKRNADTLERIAMCGYAEHVHSASCFSGDVLVCGMEEHIHTDACYQESPASMDMDDLDIEVDEPIVDETVEDLDLSLELDGLDLVTEDVPAQPVANAPQARVYTLGTGAMVSHIIGAVGLGIGISDLVEVAAVENDEAHSGLIAVEKVDGDYRVWAKRDFAEAELALIITDDIYVVKLTDGIAQREDATPEVQPAIEDAPAVQIGADAPAELPAMEDAPAVDAHAGDDDHVEVPVIEDEAPVDGQDEDTLHVEDVSPKAEQQVGKGEQLDIEDVPGEQAGDQGDEQPAGEAGEAQGEESAVGEAAEGLSLEEAGEEQGDEQPAGEAGEEQGEEPAVGEAAEGLSLEEADEAQGEEQPAEEADEAQGDEQPAGEAGEAQGDGQPAEGSDEAQGDEQPAEGSDEEQGDGQPSEEADEAQVDGQPSEEADEEQPSEEAADEQSEEEVAEEQATGESESPVYTATIDLAEVEAYPLSLNAMLAEAKPEAAEAEEAAVEGEAGEEAALEEEADAEANPTPIIEYDTELLEVVEQDGDWLVTPIRGFEETRIAVDNGSRYELTLVNCVLADEAGEEQEEQLEEQPAPVYTATVDLTDATYPLSLNAMLATVTPALDGEQAAQDDEQPAEAQDDEQPAEAQSEEQPAERPTPAIEYDEALLEIAESDGDHLITPIQSFENTRIIVDNGSRYELTLVNCVLTDEGQAEQPEAAYPAQDFEGRTDYVKVTVSAPEGAFPEGTTMTVADVEDEKTITDIEEKVSEGFVEVKRVHAVDITFWNGGVEIEPLAPVSVVISVAEIEEQQDTVVVHVEDGGATEVVDSQSEAPAGETEVTMEMPASDNAPAGAEQSSGEGQADGTEESQAFSADSFSVYAVVVTETIETKYIDAEGETWNISVGFTKEANIPVGATLDVRALADEESAGYYDQTADALKGRETITMARFFDITIRNAEGAEVQPEAPVEVKVVLDETSGDAVKAVHFADEGMELIDAERDAKAVTFEAEGFSVYGIVYTVDFYYGVDGETYEYHINGGDVMSLRELLPILGVVAEDEAAGFVADTETVTFSDETLVKPVAVTEDTTAGAIVDALGVEITYSGQLDEEAIDAMRAREFIAPDWALASLRPFNTEESLTITLKNGEVVTVKVEDHWDNTIKTYPSYAGTIGVSGYDRGESVVARILQTNENGRNAYRFYATSKPGYVFAKWKETNMGDDGSNSWDFNDLSDSTNAMVLSDTMSMDIFNSRNHDLVAVFEEIHRRVGVESDDQQKGKILAPGPYTTNTEAWYGNNWNNNGMNSMTIEAIPNEGCVFVRWNYYEEVSSNKWQLATPSDIDLFQQSFAPGTFRVDRDGKGWFLKAVFATTHVKVSVNNESVGDVVRLSDNTSMKGQYVTDEQGNLLPGMEIKAKSTNSNYAFSHWTLNDAILDITSDTITADNWPKEVKGDNLQAVFAKVIDANGNAHSTIQVDDDEKEKFQRWLASLESDQKLSADKTAHVYDYDNRIYQIDITAQSARVNPYANIGVAFILDASNSMQFPSNLQKTGKTMVLTQETMDAAFPGERGPYYIISEPTKTATVYQVYKDPDRPSDDTWYAIDASYYYARNGALSNRVWTLKTTNHYADVDEASDTLLAYPIYRAVGDKKRVDYLNQSMQGTIDAMRDIVMQVNNSNYNISVAHTMFAAFTEHYYDSNNVPGKLGSFHTVDFRKLGANDGININMGDTDGGTRHDLGLQEAINYINWNTKGIPNDQRYAILISDGAAVIPGGSNGTTWDNHNYDWIQSNIVTQATNLKNMGVKLITVGLSTKNVDGGSNVLKSIASDGLFFEAESGEDLENILYKILQTVVKNATSCGQIVDEVDEAFYPVMPNGTPIPGGTTYYRYGDNGQIIPLTKAQYDALSDWTPRFKWVENNGKWTITWEHQYIGWDSTDSDSRKHPWHESFLVKAKENFLGGNTISTNDGGKVIEDGYTYDDTLTENINNWTLFPNDNAKTKITLPVPHVNVDELSLSQNSTAWKVYLGTEVNPLDELKRLYAQIDVNEVVSQTVEGRHVTMTSAGDMLYEMRETAWDGRAPKDGMAPETFKLSAVAPLSDDDWETLIGGNAVEKAYTAYSHDNVGKVVYTLTKEVVSGEPGLEPSPHDTAVEGQNVEKYTLTATYVPTEQHTPENGWHTTPGEARGNETDDMQSVNGHVIHVFVKGIMIKKMDATLQNRLIGAKFRLYRPALSEDTENTLEIEGGNYVPATEEFTVDGDGVADIGAIKALKSGNYYLVETKAPAGYVAAAPMEVALTLQDTFAEVPLNSVVEERPSVKPYNWVQKANLVLEGSARRSDENWNATDQTPAFNSETSTVYYRIPNNSGVSLPNTGGAGTTLYYVAGTALLVLALVLLLRRRSEY